MSFLTRSLPSTMKLFPYLLIPPTVFVLLSGVRHVIFQFAPGLTWLHTGELHRLIDVNGEGNLTVWFSAGLWLVFGILCLVIGALAGIRGPFYTFAAIGFYASMDETAMIHEMFNAVGHTLGSSLGTDIPTWPWVVFFGLPLALLVGLVSLRLMRILPRQVRTTLIWAGAFFLTAVIVLETISGFYVTDGEITNHVIYILVTHAEEYLEMVAISLAVSALASLLVVSPSQRTISVSPGLTQRKQATR